MTFTPFIQRRYGTGEWEVRRGTKVFGRSKLLAGPFDTRDEAEQWIKDNAK